MAKKNISTDNAAAKAMNSRLGVPVNVKHYGAVGDGVTDDTAAIQAAVDSGASELYIPEGYYKISSSIEISSSINIKGANRTKTTIESSDNIALIKFIGSGYPRWHISDLRLNYSADYDPPNTYLTDSVSYGERKAILIDTSLAEVSGHIEQSVFKNIEILNAWYGVYNNSGAWDISFENVFIRNTTFGFYWHGGTTISLNNVLVNNSSNAFDFMNIYNLGLYQCGADEVNANEIAGLGDNVVEMENVYSAEILGWSSEGCSISRNSANYFNIVGCHGVCLLGAYVIGLTWDGVGGSAYQTFIKVSNSSSSILIENYMIPIGAGSHYHINSPAQIAFITAESNTTGTIEVKGCKFDNLTALEGSSTSVYFIQQTYIKSIKNVHDGYNFSIDRGFIVSSSSPSIGYVKKGVIVYNDNPSASGNIGWVCVADGNPGTWKSWGNIDA